jgi:hypothetical protein
VVLLVLGFPSVSVQLTVIVFAPRLSGTTVPLAGVHVATPAGSDALYDNVALVDSVTDPFGGLVMLMLGPVVSGGSSTHGSIVTFWSTFTAEPALCGSNDQRITSCGRHDGSFASGVVNSNVSSVGTDRAVRPLRSRFTFEIGMSGMPENRYWTRSPHHGWKPDPEETHPGTGPRFPHAVSRRVKPAGFIGLTEGLMSIPSHGTGAFAIARTFPTKGCGKRGESIVIVPIFAEPSAGQFALKTIVGPAEDEAHFCAELP